MTATAMRIPLHEWILLIVGSGLFFYVVLFGSPSLKDQELHVDEPEGAYWEAPIVPFLDGKESIVIDIPGDTSAALPVRRVLFEYVEVVDGCAEHFEGDCVNVRSGPGTDFPVVARLRNHVVLKVDGKVEREGRAWFNIVFDEVLRYPERVTSDWYVAADYVRVVLDEGERTTEEHGTASTTKRIVVDRGDQTLIAYEGDRVFLETAISTGLELTPTPRGTFTVFKKTPSRYMQGPAPGLPPDYYDLPGVPWNLYFTEGGAVIHGAYWHRSFGEPYSHGCVNLPSETARILYRWADLGTTVIVQD